MPELPEIETLARSLNAVLCNRQIADVRFFRDDLREKFDKPSIKKSLIQAKVRTVTRRSKYCLIHTSKGSVAIHLGMSGQLLLKEYAKPDVPHTHVVFELSDNNALHFVDPRRFGRIFPFLERNMTKHKFFRHLGIEPLQGSEEELAKYIFEMSRERKGSLKNFLMDQKVVVGVGNIYASEALHHAGLSPTRPAGSITIENAKKLSRCVRKVLQEAIDFGGSTIRDYRTTGGESGGFQKRLFVYDRQGMPCKACASAIAQVKISGRSSFFCPICQK